MMTICGTCLEGDHEATHWDNQSVMTDGCRNEGCECRYYVEPQVFVKVPSPSQPSSTPTPGEYSTKAASYQGWEGSAPPETRWDQ